MRRERPRTRPLPPPGPGRRTADRHPRARPRRGRDRRVGRDRRGTRTDGRGHRRGRGVDAATAAGTRVPADGYAPGAGLGGYGAASTHGRCRAGSSTAVPVAARSTAWRPTPLRRWYSDGESSRARHPKVGLHGSSDLVDPGWVRRQSPTPTSNGCYGAYAFVAPALAGRVMRLQPACTRCRRTNISSLVPVWRAAHPLRSGTLRPRLQARAGPRGRARGPRTARPDRAADRHLLGAAAVRQHRDGHIVGQ